MKLEKPRKGQPKSIRLIGTMSKANGHWYGPDSVAEFIVAEREACAETAESAMSDATKYDIAEAIRMRAKGE